MASGFDDDVIDLGNEGVFKNLYERRFMMSLIVGPTFLPLVEIEQF